MRRALLLQLGLVACAPDWVHDSYEPTARASLIRAAAEDHRCPTERIHVRCDATSKLAATHGKLVVGDDRTIRTLVDAAPQWELELDVCGHVRRYGHEPYALTPFVERRRFCDGARGCVAVEPPCRTVAFDMWWAIEASAPPSCTDPPIDEGITVAVEMYRVEVAFDRVRTIGTRCHEPSLLVAINGDWFALCGEPDLASQKRIASGLAVAPGTHELMVVLVEPDGRCVRSWTQTIEVRPPPISWIDL